MENQTTTFGLQQCDEDDESIFYVTQTDHGPEVWNSDDFTVYINVISKDDETQSGFGVNSVICWAEPRDLMEAPCDTLIVGIIDDISKDDDDRLVIFVKRCSWMPVERRQDGNKYERLAYDQTRVTRDEFRRYVYDIPDRYVSKTHWLHCGF